MVVSLTLTTSGGACVVAAGLASSSSTGASGASGGGAGGGAGAISGFSMDDDAEDYEDDDITDADLQLTARSSSSSGDAKAAPKWQANEKRFQQFCDEFIMKANDLPAVGAVLRGEHVTGSKGRVYIGTVHSAKGLEWDSVFLPYFVDGQYVHNRCCG